MKKILFLLLLPLFAQAQSYNDTYLVQEADTIRLETLAGRNTAKRVGRNLKNLAQNKLNLQGGTLTGTLNSSVSNLTSLSTSGNTTSNTVSDITLSRSGTASLAAGQGSSIILQNTTSSKGLLIQNSDNIVQIFNSNGGGWSEGFRLNSVGLPMFGNRLATAGAVADANIIGVKAYGLTSDPSTFHLAGSFQAELSVAAPTQSIQGVEGYTKVTHSSGHVQLAIGAVGNIELSSTGIIDQATSTGGGLVLFGTGTVAEWHGLHASAANPGGGVITKGVGVYVDVFPSGTVGKWNIITNDTNGVQLFHGFLIMPDLPSSASGLITGSIWQDPADSHRLKWVP